MRAIVFVLLLAGQSFAASIGGNYDGLPFFVFPETPPPATLKWEIATAADVRVGFTMTGIPANFGGLQQFGITEATAPQFTLDWDAFESAANNPLFTRSILTFGGVVKEGSVVRSFVPGNFRLDTIGISVDSYQFPAAQHGILLLPHVAAGAGMRADVPEPGTIGLFVIGLVFVHWRKR